MKRHLTLYAYYKFARFLEREFRWPVIVFALLVFGGGLLIHLFYRTEKGGVETLTVGGDSIGFVEACYGVLSMVFTQNYFKFPREWYLQILFFLVPVIGLGAVANSLVRLGYFIFTKKQKLPEWHCMIASTIRNHLVVVGVGRVGYRILQELRSLKEDVVAIEKNSTSSLVAEMINLGVPVIIGEARLRQTLEDANLKYARAVILATDDDLTNIDAALTSREINPDIRIVLRLFDDTMATKVAAAIGFPAISESSAAAPALIAAATGRHIYQSFQIGGQKLHVVGLTVSKNSRLKDRNVGEIQKEFSVNIVMHQSDGKTAVNPDHDVRLNLGNQIVFIASIDCVARLEELNR
jgi:Trk K+ transport system NAD-binding subunit